MASCFENITLFRYNDSTKQFEPLIQPNNLKLEFSTQQRDLILYISNPKTTETIHIQLPIAKLSSFRISALQIVIDNSEIRKIGTIDLSNFLLEFISESDLLSFAKKLSGGKSTGNKKSTIDNSLANQFDNRTEKWSATQYFQFYSYLSQQQNMMQDYVRTATYQRAVLANCADFRNKVVLDVGAGSGILSFFAAQAGAKKVYAVEASNMARFCEQLVHNNKLAGKIIVMSGKIEEVVIPEPVDVLISEPMGYMLFNERMLETYVHARKFLRAAPVMFPTVANLYIAPFTDESLYMEQASKSNFWFQQAFHGVDLSSVRESANRENFSQPIVDTFDVGVCMAAPIAHRVDFRTVEENELQEIEIPLKFTFQQTGCCHGLAVWFDVGFLGSAKDVWLSTGPTEPLTHWYQVRCLFVTPLFVYENQNVVGRMVMVANARQSYDVDIELSLPGTSCRVANTLDLKNPYFRYTGQPVQPPPGNQTKPPTENYFNIYNSHNNQSDNAMDYNQQSTVIASDIIQSSPMKNPTISWSAAGESFNSNSIPQPTNFSFLQTNNTTTTNNNNSIIPPTSNNVANIGEYAPLSPFPKTTDEDDNWDLPKHI